MFAKLQQILNQEEGQSMAEYGLILSLVAVAAIAGFTLLGGNVNTMVSNLAGKINP
ncbi:MAG: Flp family type IVb pilin [Candidatus Sericytochromatia bacterium]|nr:Flp family type IVb pilin [Candidatus Tanganyikabacteria bacterium]